MTDEEAFKQLAVEALGGFGWTVTVDDLPDYDSAYAVLRRLNDWWLGLDQFTRDLISGFDLADGLWNSGWMNEWPGLYQLISGNPFGRFKRHHERHRQLPAECSQQGARLRRGTRRHTDGRRPRVPSGSGKLSAHQSASTWTAAAKPLRIQPVQAASGGLKLAGCGASRVRKNADFDQIRDP